MLNSFKEKEIIQKLHSSSIKAFERKNYELSFVYARQAYLLNNRDIDVMETYIFTLFNLADYETMLTIMEDWFHYARNPEPEKRGKMHYLKGKALMEMGQYSKVQENLHKASTSYTHSKHTERVADCQRILQDELPKKLENPPTKSTEDKREECILIKKYLEASELPDSIDKPVYIVPADWLQKWKAYNDYDELVGDGGSKNLMDEETEKPKWVGPIMPHNLLTDTFNLIDSNEDEMYTNFQLKQGLVENKDFYIVNEEFWQYISGKYKGIPLKRFTYRKSETDLTISVEVWLHKVEVLVLPVPAKQPADIDKEDTVYFSKKKSVADLGVKLGRIYAEIFARAGGAGVDKKAVRLWKVDPRFNLKRAWDRWPGGSSTFGIEGEVLKDDELIENSEISEEDTVIVEFRVLASDWFLFNSSETNKYKKRKGMDEENNGSTSGSSYHLDDVKKFPSSSKKGLTGLQNLGNTCFMNSALQCLSNTFELTTYFLTDEYEKDINEKNPLGTGGRLARAYSALLKEMWMGNHGYVSPWDLKKTIGKLASQFVGYGQQDSQELLSYLLDGLHEDLNRVKVKPVVETKENDTRPDEIVAAESWENHLKRNRSKIQELMHGQFKSTLYCPDCKRISITFDPFMMLSLPIPNIEYAKIFVYFIYHQNRKIPSKINLTFPSTATTPDILNRLAQLTKSDEKQIVMGLLKEHKLVEYVDENATATYLKDHPGIIFAYELPEIAPNPMSTEEKKSRIKVYIQSEPKAFYESEKTISYTRLIIGENTDTLRDIYIKVYEKMRHHIHNYYTKQNLDSPVNIDDKTPETLISEYDKIFSDENESKWLYKLHYRDENPKEKAKSKPCSNLDEKEKFTTFLQRQNISEQHICFEVKITKNSKPELLGLNQCTELSAGEDGEGDPSKGYNVYDCLNSFTKKERLEKGNEWYCSKCKEHKQAEKKMELYKAPQILIVHLKRFKTSKVSNIGSFYFSHGSKKITSLVEFPLEGLDLGPYILGEGKDSSVYDLFAVSNHYGGLGGGHYTAYAKNPFEHKWYDFNDSSVHGAGSKEIVTPAAYVLFYKKRTTAS